MADPRNTVKLEGIREERATYLIDGVTITFSATAVRGSAAVDKAVTLSADKTVALAADGEFVLGKLIAVESDGKAIVADEGYVTLPAGTGASVTLGKKIVGALLSSAKGYVREVATATAAELGVCRGAIIENDTTTALVIKL